VFQVTLKITLCLEEQLIPKLFLLLQQGFLLKARVGCSIQSFLCQQLGLSPEYVDERIQTIFLDGRPVDDLNSGVLKEGSTLALSAALPGLVGATLRKGGYYALMRSEISSREEIPSGPLREGVILMKLFNTVLKELGPTFLKEGVRLKGENLSDFLTRQPDDFWIKCKGVRIDGEKAECSTLLEIDWAGRHVLLQVNSP
jgi:hypothetical protein